MRRPCFLCCIVWPQEYRCADIMNTFYVPRQYVYSNLVAPVEYTSP
jgi:hypothetical protein